MAEENIKEVVYTIHNLNDDFLERIFLQLPIYDRVRLGGVCKKWKAISEQSWSNIKKMAIEMTFYGGAQDKWNIKLFKSTGAIFQSAGEEISPKSIIKLLTRCGRFLDQLDISGQFMGTMDFINTTVYMSEKHMDNHLEEFFRRMGLFIQAENVSKYCGNLTTLNIRFPIFTDKELKIMFSTFKKLENVSVVIRPDDDLTFLHKLPEASIKKLEFTRYTGYSNEDPEIYPVVQNIQHLQNLETLVIEQFSVSVKALESLAEIQTLHSIVFENCDFACHSSINGIANLRNLKFLALTIDKYTDPITDEFLCKLAENCKSLENLSIRNAKNFNNRPTIVTTGLSAIADFPKLQTLSLQGLIVDLKYVKMMPTLKSFSASKEYWNGLKLENFYFEADDLVISVLQHAPNLEYLQLRWSRIEGIPEKLLKTADEVTRQRDNNLKLTVIALGDIKKIPEYNSPLLKFVRNDLVDHPEKYGKSSVLHIDYNDLKRVFM